jgi:hypothetical protein
MADLPSTINSEKVRREVATAAAERFGRKCGNLVYEHGQWWLCRPDGSQYSVVDVENSESNSRFGFEQVKEADTD